MLDKTGAHFDDTVVEHVKKGGQFRIIGDNLNFKVHKHDVRQDRQDSMRNMFASAIILNKVYSNLPKEPLIQIADFSPRDVLPSSKDLAQMRLCYINTVCAVVAEHIPLLSFFKDAICKEKTPFSEQLKEKTDIVPLAVLPFNEQCYEDDVKILSYYETIVRDIYGKAGVPLGTTQVHVGGDQLTRERFSQAKSLRLGVDTSPGNFSTLSPITAEFFHLDMNFLECVIFKRLYKEKSVTDLGTMKCEQQRIDRTNVKADAHKAYEADQEFFCSFVKAYIVEMILQYFGMEDINSQPTKHCLPSFQNQNDRSQWVRETIGRAVDEFVLNTWKGTELQQLQQEGNC